LNTKEGTTEITNSVFNRSISALGLIIATAASSVRVNNTRFERILGQDQASLFFVIQNQGGPIHLQDSLVLDSYAKIATVSLTFAEFHSDNVTFLGNFAEVSSNGISMIFSHCTIRNSVVDNERNVNGIAAGVISAVQTGFINMNY
jgi:hypothetical protein